MIKIGDSVYIHKGSNKWVGCYGTVVNICLPKLYLRVKREFTYNYEQWAETCYVSVPYENVMEIVKPKNIENSDNSVIHEVSLIRKDIENLYSKILKLEQYLNTNTD